MMEYLTALECKNKTATYLETRHTPEIDMIYEDIYEEIQLGHLFVFKEGKLAEPTVRFLKAKGFSVSSYMVKGKEHYEIKWG